MPEVPAVEVETTTEEQPAPAKKAPQVKERREYTGPKVEGERLLIHADHVPPTAILPEKRLLSHANLINPN